eukprot:1195415-Prorocentrum_minimum.AAC.7
MKRGSSASIHSTSQSVDWLETSSCREGKRGVRGGSFRAQAGNCHVRAAWSGDPATNLWSCATQRVPRGAHTLVYVRARKLDAVNSTVVSHLVTLERTQLSRQFFMGVKRPCRRALTYTNIT